jgi:hypothetical protein
LCTYCSSFPCSFALPSFLDALSTQEKLYPLREAAILNQLLSP